MPVVDVHYPDRWRIYFSTRDEDVRSHPTFVDVEPGMPENIIAEGGQIMPLGEPGEFDETGITPTWVTINLGLKYLYYVGWSRKKSVSFDNHTGLAISEDGIHFQKIGPILGKCPVDRFFTGTMCVLRDSDFWRGYYMSGLRWKDGEPSYNIKYAESADGITWDRRGVVCIDLEGEEEGVCTASAIKVGDEYRMWFSHRNGKDYRDGGSNSYRIGYARSLDGVVWARQPGRGVSPRGEGWESSMTCSPYVIRYGDRLFMFYNGNQFGRTGIGYATAEIQE